MRRDTLAIHGCRGATALFAALRDRADASGPSQSQFMDGLKGGILRLGVQGTSQRIADAGPI
jgi:hypothetical protein